MDVFPPSSSGQDEPPKSAPGVDSRLQPTPDYGTLGPGSDIQTTGPVAATPSTPGTKGLRVGAVIAVTVGVFLAVVIANIGSAHAAWARFAGLFS